MRTQPDAADVGIAIGAGADVAIETADIVLVSADLRALVDAIDLGRRVARKIRQNLFWAFAYNVALIPLAGLGVIHPALAAGAMALSSVSVVVSSLSLRRGRAGGPILPSMRRTSPLPAVGLALALACVGGCSDDHVAAGGQAGQSSVLTIFAPPSPAEAVIWASDPYDPGKRQRGILLLSSAPWGGEPVYVEMYVFAAQDGDPAVRAAALRALSEHATLEEAPILIAAMSDPSGLVRREAARALQRVHTERAIPVLVRALDEQTEPEADVRAFSARALGQYPTPSVVQALIGALNDRRLSVNESARQSLRILTGQDFRYDVAAWVDWTSVPDRNLFAAGEPYKYPIFRRRPTLLERVVPWMNPPNETQSRPIGMPPDAAVAGAKPPDKEGG